MHLHAHLAAGAWIRAHLPSRALPQGGSFCKKQGQEQSKKPTKTNPSLAELHCPPSASRATLTTAPEVLALPEAWGPPYIAQANPTMHCRVKQTGARLRLRVSRKLAEMQTAQGD